MNGHTGPLPPFFREITPVPPGTSDLDYYPLIRDILLLRDLTTSAETPLAELSPVTTVHLIYFMRRALQPPSLL